MLTIRELLMQLPEDVRQLAIDNTKEFILDSKEENGTTPKQALGRAFIWQTTIQGHDFWQNVSTSLP